MKKRILLVLICFVSITQLLAQENKKYPSRFWEITGNGLTKPSYLYGTMHVSKKLAYYLPDTFFIALNNVDAVALENNPDYTLEEMVNSELFGIANNPQLRSSYSNFYKNSFLVTVPKREDYARLLAADPDLVNEMMFRFSNMEGQQGDFEESTYLDLFIYQCAKRLNKKMVGLETFDGAMKLYLKAVNPENKEIEKKEKKSDTLAYENEEDNEDYISDRNLFKQIEDAYRLGDLDLLDSMAKKSYPTKLYGKYLINDRNIIMANNMDSIMKKQTLFTGVGAAHLPGKDGIIELLRSKGYTVKPISLNKMKNAGKMKEKLEDIRLPLSYNTFTSDDNIISVNVPKNMYEIYVFDELKQYLCVDPANSAYYTIYRIKTHNEFSGYTLQQNKYRIDSLFYEFIPGKISKKTEITKNGYQGYDVVTKTQRGDFRRYLILITPLEIIIFKASGVGEYVLQKENEQFFNSIKLNITPDKFTLFKPEFGGYQAQLPSYVIYDKKGKNIKNDKKFEKTFAYDSKGNTYMLMHATHYDYNYIEEDTFELSYLTEQFNEPLKYDLVSKKFTTQDDYPSYLSVFKNKEGNYLTTKTTINGPSYYLQAIVSDKDMSNDVYFSTLKFTKPIYNDPFFTYEDTSLHYTVTTCKKPLEDQIINYASYNNLTNRYQEKDKKPYESYTTTKFFENFKTNENIYLTYEKLHDYLSMSNIDSFWNAQLDFYKESNSVKISNLKKSVDNDITSYEFTQTDTNSTRGILTKIILRNGRLYYLNTTIDTINKPSEFISKFYSSFKPTDTIIGFSPFESKTNMFFAALESADSAKRKEAVNALKVIDFREPNVVSRFTTFLKSDKYYNYKEDDRIDIIDMYASLKAKEILPTLKDLYEKAGDSSNLQFNILNAMSRQKNMDAIKMIDSILMNDAPLPSSDYEVYKVFTPWYDTVKLASNLFPNLLKLTKYNEYKPVVFRLLSYIIDSSGINTQNYASYKSDILREANETLKRYFSKEQKNETAKKNKEDEDDYVYETNTSDEVYSLKKFIRILLPFYNEAQVKLFFDKLTKIKDNNLLLDMYGQMSLKNITVVDTVWEHFAKDLDTRYLLYNKLESIKKLDYFPKEYKTQEAIAYSLLKSSGYKEANDSMIFLEKVQVNQRNDSGWIYFFKTYYSKDKKYYLDYVGLMPYDTTKFKTKFEEEDEYDDEYDEEVYSSRAVKWNKSKLDELKQDILKTYRLADRQRVVLYDYSSLLNNQFSSDY